MINKATTTAEATNALETIKAWGFTVCANVIPFKAGYSSAQDLGFSVTETRYSSLNSLTSNVVQEIVDLMI